MANAISSLKFGNGTDVFTTPYATAFTQEKQLQQQILSEYILTREG